MPLVMAPKSMPTATPAKSSVMTGILPLRMAKKTVRHTAKMLPHRAKTGMASILPAVPPMAMATTAPVAAPAEIPIRPGSAKGLLKMPCITAPLMPKAPPTSMPTSMRGKRIYQITASCSLVKLTSCKKGKPSCCMSTAAALLKGTSICPMVRETQPTSSNKQANTIRAALP